MTFEWDEAKGQANVRKHGIDFETAKRIFDGPVGPGSISARIMAKTALSPSAGWRALWSWLPIPIGRAVFA